MGADINIAEPVCQNKVLRHYVSFPLVLACEGGRTSGEAKDADERSRMCLLDMRLEQNFVLERRGTFAAGKRYSASTGRWQRSR